MSLLTGLGGLLGGLTGGLSNTTAARTGTVSNTSSGTTNNAGTSSSMPVFNPTQTAVQTAAGNKLTSELNGGIDTTPMATAGTNAINQTYKGIGDRLQQSLGARGFGNSGASGTAALQTEVGRAGAVGDLQSNLQSYALQQQQNALQQATQFGFAAPGTSGTSTNTGSGTGSAFQTSVAPGSVVAGALAGTENGLLNALKAASAGGF